MFIKSQKSYLFAAYLFNKSIKINKKFVILFIKNFCSKNLN